MTHKYYRHIPFMFTEIVNTREHVNTTPEGVHAHGCMFTRMFTLSLAARTPKVVTRITAAIYHRLNVLINPYCQLFVRTGRGKRRLSSLWISTFLPIFLWINLWITP
jgi:hypothetical protein